MTGLKWSRRTPEKVALELQSTGIDVSPSTVGRLLKQMGFSLRANRKAISAASSPDRNEQFEYIAQLRETYACEGHPIISVDAKKRELVGLFKNQGTTWESKPPLVNDHDFRSQAKGIAIPYGIYEPVLNRGHVFVGTTHETSEFAADSIAQWWRYASQNYEDPSQLLILADGGGGNGYRSRAWKTFIQSKVADRYKVAVGVCHYPGGTSKWNPIEHRLFSEISKNWRGRPLDSYETVLKFIRTTKTKTGLRVRARLVRKVYKNGLKISDDQISQLSVEPHETLPKWNYTIRPRSNVN
jgi:hypothetical protein